MITPESTTLAISLAVLEWSKLITSVFFVFAFGAICGSFINVIVYRLPLGLSVVSPPSACPKCETKLSWRDNIPVLGWIVLRGKCRYCKNPISPEYPIVEFIVGSLFALTFILWFADPYTLSKVGIQVAYWRPEWALDGLVRTWPIALLYAGLLFALVSITLVDAKTFHIPLIIPWLLGAFALIVHPATAAWIGSKGGLRRSPHDWVIPLVDWPWMGAAFGAAVGLVISALLLKFKVLPRSFADYDEWERANTPQPESEPEPNAEPEKTEPPTTPSEPGNALLRALFFAGPIVAGMFAGLALGLRTGKIGTYVPIGAGLGMLIGLLLRRLIPEDDDRHEDDPAWIFYPHARREMVKEALFLLFPVGLAVLGYIIAHRAVGPWSVDYQTNTLVHSAPPAPLWLAALAGSLLGLVVGGGIIWAIRIGGSLAFGKEAMGLGDVHLMAGVGAVIGWVDPTVAFFIAPFFALTWVALSMIYIMLHKGGNRTPRALPFGPHLAVATLFVVLAKPVVESGLSIIMRQTVNLP